MEGDGKIHKPGPKHQTSSSSSSSSSSSFQFMTSWSMATKKTSDLCPADELFYKGQLLPLHLSPRISMLRTLILTSSSSSSAADTTTTASRDSTGSSNSYSSFSGDHDHFFLLLDGFGSARQSSTATEEEEEEEEDSKKTHQPKKSKYLYPSKKLSSVFLFKDGRRETLGPTANASSSKRITATAKEILKRYVKNAKPFCERALMASTSMLRAVEQRINPRYALWFSGNLRCPRRKTCISSCPTLIRSSSNHSGVQLLRIGGGRGGYNSDLTSMEEELQSAIQGAIAHCKKSMVSEV